MNPAKLTRFADAGRFFICPICREPLRLDGASLVCANRHRFDVARQGYVNLAPAARRSRFYDRESFLARGEILRRGYYDHIVDAVLDAVARFDPRSVLDVGCGEGFYARAVQRADPSRAVLAFDIAKDSVQLAARDDETDAVRWFVGNLADLPLADGSVDCMLDVFSPANHAEFARVLAPGGVVVKAIPGARHDVELREAARDQLRHDDYANDEVVEGFAERFEILERRLVTRTLAMPPEDVLAFARMTPLLFHADVGRVDLSRVTSLTVEAEIVVGRPR